GIRLVTCSRSVSNSDLSIVTAAMICVRCPRPALIAVADFVGLIARPIVARTRRHGHLLVAQIVDKSGALNLRCQFYQLFTTAPSKRIHLDNGPERCSVSLSRTAVPL